MISLSRQLKAFFGYAIIVFVSTIPLAAGATSQVILSAKFEGRSDHIVSGGVSVMKTDSGFLVVLEKDFSLDDAPDIKLG